MPSVEEGEVEREREKWQEKLEKQERVQSWHLQMIFESKKVRFLKTSFNLDLFSI